VRNRLSLCRHPEDLPVQRFRGEIEHACGEANRRSPRARGENISFHMGSRLENIASPCELQNQVVHFKAEGRGSPPEVQLTNFLASNGEVVTSPFLECVLNGEAILLAWAEYVNRKLQLLCYSTSVNWPPVAGFRTPRAHRPRCNLRRFSSLADRPSGDAMIVIP
jgi:hypothetical protein